MSELAEGEKIYNQILSYYDHANLLIELAQNSLHNLSEKQFEIVENFIEKLQKNADQLADLFIECVDSGASEKRIESARLALNNILAEIQKCQNAISALYKDPF